MQKFMLFFAYLIVCVCFLIISTLSSSKASSQTKGMVMQPSTTQKTENPPSGFVYVKDIHSDIRISPRYYSTDNFMGRPFTAYLSPFLMISKEAAEALRAVQEDVAKDGFDLVIYDAYRPQSTVDSFSLWANDLEDQCMKDAYYPTIDKRKVFELGYIATKSSHTRGSTVDLTLIQKGQAVKPTQKKQRTLLNGMPFQFLDDNTVDMHTHFDLFDESSWHDTPLIPTEATEKRNYLRSKMEAHGFQPYDKEWWHYTLKNEPFPKTYFDFSIQ